MVAAFRPSLSRISKCPHCGGGFIALDKDDQEPYCCICGWRRATRIPIERAGKCSAHDAKYWNKLFASADNPDEICELWLSNILSYRK